MKKIIVINFIIICSLVFFFEVSAKYFNLSQLLGIDSHLFDYNQKEKNNFKFKKNFTGVVFDNSIFTDENGFRVPYLNFKYNNNNSVAIIGDSVAFGNGVDEPSTFVGMIRNSFDNINIYNFSLPGYQLHNHLINIDEINKIKNLSKIIYFYTLNDADFKNNIQYLNEKDLKSLNSDYISKIKNINFINRLNFWLIGKSQFYNFIKGILTDPSKRWFYYDYELYKNNNTLSKIEKSFLELQHKINKKKIEFIIIFLPYEFQTRIDNCNSLIHMPQIKLESLAQKHNIKHLSLIDLFCKQKKNKDFYLKYDPMHFSIKGHAYVFENIKNEIF